MTKDEAVAHYGTQAKLADALGIRQPSVAAWGDTPPVLQQLALEALTHGALRAGPECDRYRVTPLVGPAEPSSEAA